MTIAVRWQDKTCGAIGFVSIFLLHFLHQGKKWKKTIESKKTFEVFLAMLEITIKEALIISTSITV
jgi:hypothetical protein